MSIKHINESFERLASNTKPVKELKEKFDPTLRDLTSSLNQVIESLEKKGSNVMLYESAFQNEIEKFFPDKSWWEVTDIDISSDLFERKDPRMTAKRIVESIRRKPMRESSDDKLVIYKSLGKYKITPKSNYSARIQNARKIHSLDDFSSADEIIDYYVKNGWAKGKEDFEILDESKKITERNLTRSERHNRDMEKIFSTKKSQDEKIADFLRKNGYSEEQVDKLQKQDKLSYEIAKKFTPDGKQPSDVLGKILKESDDEIEYEKKYYSKLRPDGTGEIEYWEVDAPKHPKDWGRGERNRVVLDKKEWQKRAFGIKENKNLKEAEAPAGYSPKKQGKAYKVFRVKNGKLYPPMVANPGGEDTPIGKWLIADEGEFAGLSKTGRPQVKSSQGGTLSYRPGWHLGDIPRASQFDRTNKETGEKEFPKDFVWAECSYTMDVDYQPESDEQGYMRIDKDGKPYRSDKYQHSLAGLPKLPKDGYYKYRTNPRPDTVPWVITGAIKVDRLLSDAEVNAILERNGVEPIHRQGGDKTLAELGLRESLNRKSVKEDWWNNQSNYTVLDHEDEYPTNGQWFDFVFDFYNGRLGYVTETNRGHTKARDADHAIEKFWRSHEKASDGKSGFILTSVKDESGKEYLSEKLSNKRKLKESFPTHGNKIDLEEVIQSLWEKGDEIGGEDWIEVFNPNGVSKLSSGEEYCNRIEVTGADDKQIKISLKTNGGNVEYQIFNEGRDWKKASSIDELWKVIFDRVGRKENESLRRKPMREETDWDTYAEIEKEQVSDYSNRVKSEITPQVRRTFSRIKNVLENESRDAYVDGFYFPQKAVDMLKGGNRYHLNKYMDINVSDTLNMIDENGSVEEAIDSLFVDYKPGSAYSWASNFVANLKKINGKNESFTKKHAKKLKESHRRKLTESFDDMEVFMNTWANYNEYGADGVLTPTGWMSIDEAIEYCEEYADYEPFINDTDNVPFDDINEYSNASSALEELKELQESDVDEEAVKAIVEAGGYDIKEAIEIAESGDYYFYPGLSSYTDLAYELIDELGGIGEAVGKNVVNYIDEDQMRREYRWDIREIMRDSAEDEVDREHYGEDEDSYDREQEIEDWMDEHEDEYLDMVIDEDIRMAEAGEVDLSNYFDYEAFGRDLSFDGYTIVDNGIIYIP